MKAYYKLHGSRICEVPDIPNKETEEKLQNYIKEIQNGI